MNRLIKKADVLIKDFAYFLMFPNYSTRNDYDRWTLFIKKAIDGDFDNKLFEDLGYYDDEVLEMKEVIEKIKNVGYFFYVQKLDAGKYGAKSKKAVYTDINVEKEELIINNYIEPAEEMMWLPISFLDMLKCFQAIGKSDEDIFNLMKKANISLGYNKFEFEKWN